MNQNKYSFYLLMDITHDVVLVVVVVQIIGIALSIVVVIAALVVKV